MLKFIKKYLMKTRYACYKKGHNWRMKIGWQSNKDWEPEIHGFYNPKFPPTKKWIYYECKRCGAHGE